MPSSLLHPSPSIACVIASYIGTCRSAHFGQQVLQRRQSKSQSCSTAQRQCPLLLHSYRWQKKEAPFLRQQLQLFFKARSMATFTPSMEPFSLRYTSLHQSRHSRWAQCLPSSGPQKGPAALLSPPYWLLRLQKQQRTGFFLSLKGCMLGVLAVRYCFISSFSTDSTDPSESNSMGACLSLRLRFTSSPRGRTVRERELWSLPSMSARRNLQFLGWWMGMARVEWGQKLLRVSWMSAMSLALYLQLCRIFLRILSQSSSTQASRVLLKSSSCPCSPSNCTATRTCSYYCIQFKFKRGNTRDCRRYECGSWFQIQSVMKRGKQNSQNSTNQFVSSTYRVESDQKELIIKALRGDHEVLKKNEGEYYRLHEQYKQLQGKYKLLSDEKGNDDRDFKMKHEAAVRNIGQLKNEIDALRAELRDKKLEIGDLESDSGALRQQLDEKNIELENFKNDFKGCMADSEELGAEREGLSNAASKLRGIISQIQEEERLLREDNGSVDKRLEELEKYQGQLVLQERILREKIQGYENENNELDSSINELCDALSELEIAIKKAQDELVDLQQQTSEAGLLNEKYKTENQHVQRSTQAEILKNNNLLKALKNAEYTSKVRGGQVEEADREVGALKEEKNSLGHINEKLSEDLEACRAHLENLGLINTKLVEHLQNFSSEDEAVRELVHRKARVEGCRSRVGEAQKSSFSYLGSEKLGAETRIGSSRREYR